MIIIKILIIKLLFFFFIINNSFSSYIEIEIKVDGEIITSHDIYKESEYLKVLNPNIINLNKEQILEIARNALVTEIIKKKEIEKSINIDEKDISTSDYIKNLYSRLNIKNLEEFKILLSNKNTYSINEVEQKIKIELLWNDLIFSKYINQVKISEDELKIKVNNMQNQKIKEYSLSEIVFKKRGDQSIESLINEIKLSINSVGFSNTANIYSLSDTSKFGGKLNWINENILSKEILSKINFLKINDISEILKFGNNYLILKIDDIRELENKIDKNQELEKLINAEKNRQLNQFSMIYFNKSKINYLLSE